RDESDRFLRSWGLDDGVCGAVFDHCRGHPLATDLAREVWQQAVAAGRPLRADELRSEANHRAAIEWLMTRLIERHSPSFGAAVLAAALLRELTLEVLN